MGQGSKGKALAKPTPEQINQIGDQVKKDIRKTIYKWLWKWIGIICLILTAGIGITFWRIYITATDQLQNILVNHISEEFKQPTIRKTIEDVAANNAKQIFINEIMPEVSKFKAEINNEQNKQKEAIIVLEKGQATITNRMNIIEAKEQSHLKEKYPKGYAILGFPSEHAVIAHTEYVPKGINVDWNTAKVIAITGDTIRVRVPDVKDSRGNSIVRSIITLDKKVGSRQNYVAFDDWILVASVLSIQKDLIVIAIGFEPKK